MANKQSFELVKVDGNWTSLENVLFDQILIKVWPNGAAKAHYSHIRVALVQEVVNIIIRHDPTPIYEMVKNGCDLIHEWFSFDSPSKTDLELPFGWRWTPSPCKTEIGLFGNDDYLRAIINVSNFKWGSISTDMNRSRQGSSIEDAKCQALRAALEEQ